MNGLLPAVVAAVLAGAMIPLGAMLAKIEHVRPRWVEEELRHGVVAFGGGLLVSVVAFMLVPVGAGLIPTSWAVVAFCLGGAVHCLLDKFLEPGTNNGGDVIALVSDFLPEAMAMGAMFATGSEGAIVMALMIGVQNLPEGFNSYHALRTARRNKNVSLWAVLGLIMLVGVIAAVFGHAVLASNPSALGLILVFAAGGIFYLVFQDIAYEAHMERAWAPALGAVAGFAIGMLGHHLNV
jgi:zinc transporter, ZIP family